MSEQPDNCAHCRFGWKRSEDAEIECRRFPPTLTDVEHAEIWNRWKFPVMLRHGWCGEFQRREAGA